MIRSTGICVLILTLLTWGSAYSNELSVSDAKLVHKCKSLAQDPWDPRSTSTDVRISNIPYHESIDICSDALSKLAFADREILEDLRHWLARSLIAKSFQKGRSFDPKGIKLLHDLSGSGYCSAYVGLLRIYRYALTLPVAERERVLQELVYGSNQDNEDGDPNFEGCTKLSHLMAQNGFDSVIYNKRQTKDKKIKAVKANISYAKKTKDADTLYWAFYSYNTLSESERQDVWPDSSLTEELLNESATQGHVGAMLQYYDNFFESENTALARKSDMWLEKATALKTDGALVRCITSSADIGDDVRSQCLRTFSNQALKSKATKIKPVFQKIAESNSSSKSSGKKLTREQILSAFSEQMILKMYSPPLEW